MSTDDFYLDDFSWYTVDGVVYIHFVYHDKEGGIEISKPVIEL